MAFISVDLPEPDGPMIATYSPGSIVNVTPCSTCTFTSPIVYVLVRSRMSITGSFIAQGLDRIELGGAIRGIRAERERHDGRETRRDDESSSSHGIGGGNARDARDEGAVRRSRRAPCRWHPPDNAAPPREQQRLDEKLREHLRAPRADRFAHADFARPFGDRHEHDVHDADARDDQRYRADGATMAPTTAKKPLIVLVKKPKSNV